MNGTVRSYTFKNLAIKVFILGINHNADLEGSNLIHFQIGKIGSTAVALCDDYYNSGSSTGNGFCMNTISNNNGGWEESYMRKTILGNSSTPTFPLSNSMLSIFSSDFQTVMKSVTKYTDNSGNASNVQRNVTATTDYLFLLASFEVLGYTSLNPNDYERNGQLQYDYYKFGNSVAAYRHNSLTSKIIWWLRSPMKSNYDGFCVIDFNGESGHEVIYSLGVRPCFVV